MMRFSGIADPEQLAILTTILNDICTAAGIAPQSDARDDIAALLLDLYQNGHCSSEQLRAALNPTLLQAITACPRCL
jgi:hypothetical protein